MWNILATSPIRNNFLSSIGLSFRYKAEAGMVFQPEIGYLADQDSKQGTCRCRHSHREQCIGKISGSQIRSRDTDQNNGNDIVDKTNIGFSICTEISGKAEMDACKNAVPDIGMDILSAKKYDRVISGKCLKDMWSGKLNDQ